MARPPKEHGKKEKQIAIRVDPELLAEIDRLVVHLEATTPGLNISRSDAIRVATKAGVELLTKQKKGTR